MAQGPTDHVASPALDPQTALLNELYPDRLTYKSKAVIRIDLGGDSQDDMAWDRYINTREYLR